MHLFRLR